MTPLYGAILNNILNNSLRQEKHEKKKNGPKALSIYTHFWQFFCRLSVKDQDLKELIIVLDGLLWWWELDDYE